MRFILRTLLLFLFRRLFPIDWFPFCWVRVEKLNEPLFRHGWIDILHILGITNIIINLLHFLRLGTVFLVDIRLSLKIIRIIIVITIEVRFLADIFEFIKFKVSFRQHWSCSSRWIHICDTRWLRWRWAIQQLISNWF